MNGDQLDAAMEECYAIEGFEDDPTNQNLIKRAEVVREEAFDTVDTSTWAQAEREKYSDFVSCSTTAAHTRTHPHVCARSLSLSRSLALSLSRSLALSLSLARV